MRMYFSQLNACLFIDILYMYLTLAFEVAKDKQWRRCRQNMNIYIYANYSSNEMADFYIKQ